MLADELVSVVAGVLLDESDEFPPVEGKLANTRDPLSPFSSLGLLKVSAIHLIEAVSIQREAHDLFDELALSLEHKAFTQPCLELRNQLLVDLANDGFDV